MYKQTHKNNGTIEIYDVTIAELIHQKVERLYNNNEPIEDARPIIHTKKEDGVIPGYNPRTDKWEEGAKMTQAKWEANKRQQAMRNKQIEERNQKEETKEQITKNEINNPETGDNSTT